jgi:hypothetical protein
MKSVFVTGSVLCLAVLGPAIEARADCQYVRGAITETRIPSNDPFDWRLSRSQCLSARQSKGCERRRRPKHLTGSLELSATNWEHYSQPMLALLTGQRKSGFRTTRVQIWRPCSRRPRSG